MPQISEKREFFMTERELLQMVDHTLLSPTASEEDIRLTVSEGILASAASVCIPPRFVHAAVSEAQGKIPVCTVVGFPLGYNDALAKVREAELAISQGAAEIDTVMPIGALLSGDLGAVREELALLRRATQGRVLKVIIETCLLTNVQKRIATRLVAESGADFVKTSTGFSTGGATVEDIALLKEEARGMGVKASGGIRSFSQALALVQAGATRIGASRLVKEFLRLS